MDTNQIIELIYNCIDTVNLLRDPDSQIPKAPQTPLTGTDSILDSLGLVNLIVEIEQHIELSCSKSVSLLGENNDSDPLSHFRNVHALASFIQSQLDA